MSLPISVFIITYNEAERIERTVQAAQRIAKQVVVIDSGSTDDTVAIAEALGAEVKTRDFDGYGPQKRFGEDQCRHEWLFNLDADEVVTADLVAELHTLFASGNPQPGAYRVKIHNVYPGNTTPRALANDYNVVRFYHRDAGRYRDHPTFDRVVLADGVSVRQLHNPVFHFSIVDWHQMIDKANRFTSHHLEKAETRNPTVLKLRLLSEFPFTFLKEYFGRRHFTGGWKGFVFALNHAFMRTMRIAKMLEKIERVRGKAPTQSL